MFGIDACEVHVEIGIGTGVPMTSIIGLRDAITNEIQDRVGAAIDKLLHDSIRQTYYVQSVVRDVQELCSFCLSNCPNVAVYSINELRCTTRHLWSC